VKEIKEEGSSEVAETEGTEGEKTETQPTQVLYRS
jgi:hypothetical protein